MKPASAAASIDTDRVARLGDQLVGWQHKAVPPRFWGATVAELVAAAPRLSELSTPLLTLSEPAVASNIATMSRWAAERGLEIAPHGKTTMAPALWARQLKARAWAITVATPAQLAVARAFGVSRVMLANEVTSPAALRWMADELAADTALELLVWADSVDGVRLMEAALVAHAARACLLCAEPGDDGCEDGAGAVDDGELVVSGGQSSPLLEGSEGAFDDVAGLVGVVVVVHGSPAARAATGAVGSMVTGLGDDRDDPALAQQGAGGP